MTLNVTSFYDTATATISHIVVDENARQCAIIDPVLDYDAAAGQTNTTSADQLLFHVKQNDLTVQWILETHIHADHLTAAFYLQSKLGGKTGISTGIRDVLNVWVPVFGTDADTPMDGVQFDCMFADGDDFKLGNHTITVWHTPGHTPACASFVADGMVFVGDTLFAPQMGTARCDFPGGDAGTLYDSIQRLYELPDETEVYLCHDYPKNGAAPTLSTTIGAQKVGNIMLNGSTSRDQFVQKRLARDETLAVPKLLYPAIQTNMRLGDLGKPAENGLRYIKIPVNALDEIGAD